MAIDAQINLYNTSNPDAGYQKSALIADGLTIASQAGKQIQITKLTYSPGGAGTLTMTDGDESGADTIVTLTFAASGGIDRQTQNDRPLFANSDGNVFVFEAFDGTPASGATMYVQYRYR